MQTTEHQAIGTSTGKIILMGEHAVVYGEPAVAIPFPATSIEATVTSSAGPITLDCLFHRGPLETAPERLKNLVAAVMATFAALEQKPENIHIQIESTIPPERGMGSSAAVAVATIRSLYHYFEKELTRETLLELVNISEMIAHGNPSGLDAAMTSGKAPLFYIKGQPFVSFELNVDAYLVVADTGVQGQTREAVASIAAMRDNQRSAAEQAIRQLGNYARNAKVAIESNDAVELGKCMNQAHETLAFLGVSNQQLDTLVKAAGQAGALGAKLTGGGKGGCMIALAKNKAAAEQISQALIFAGAVQTWEYQIGAE